jgi:phosphoribosyl-AMP cyclohydrolase
MNIAQNLKPNFAKRDGLLPVIVQDAQDNSVLMLAYANEEAFEKTLATGLATYFSTSRNEIWIKGATSNNTQTIQEILIDCDEDALIYKVIQNGSGACHTGERTCFYRKIK